MHGDAGSQRISLSSSCEGAHATIALGGWLDAAVAPRARAVVDDLPEQVTDITFDCSGLEYISSAGIRVLIEGARRCRKAGGTCSVLNVDPIVISVLGMIDASKVMRIERAEAPEKPEEEDQEPKSESQSDGDAPKESGNEEVPACGDSNPADGEVAEAVTHFVNRDEGNRGDPPGEQEETAPDDVAEEGEWRGLTLREMLIIVAILAVIVATLLPALMKALDAAPRESESLGSAPKTYAEAMQSATSETFADM